MKALALLLALIAISNAQTTPSEPKPIIISRIESTVGVHHVCIVDEKSVIVQGLPPAIVAAYKKLSALEKEVKAMADYVESQDKKIRSAKAHSPAEATSGTPAGNYIRYWNIEANRLEDKEKELKKKIAALETEAESYFKIASVEAFETKQVYQGKKVFVVKAGNKVATAASK